MELKELEKLVKEGVEKGGMKFICKTKMNNLNRDVFTATKKFGDDYDYLILLPVIYNTGERWDGLMNVYGKIREY